MISTCWRLNWIYSVFFFVARWEWHTKKKIQFVFVNTSIAPPRLHVPSIICQQWTICSVRVVYSMQLTYKIYSAGFRKEPENLRWRQPGSTRALWLMRLCLTLTSVTIMQYQSWSRISQPYKKCSTPKSIDLTTEPLFRKLSLL